jgi:beta-lactam-binding protein with PASTA domain
VVSLQFRHVRVPNVLGRPVLDALDLLGLAGFTIGAMPPSGGLDADSRCVVFEQLPEAGAMVPISTVIQLSLIAPPSARDIRCN